MNWKEELPQELWREILEIGIKSSKLKYTDLCSVSISCKLLHRLSNEDSLWSHLLSVDFPFSLPSSSSPSKSLYRFQRHRLRKLLICSLISPKDGRRVPMKLSDLRNASGASSVALNVREPEIVSARKKLRAEQLNAPVESRIRRMGVFEKAYQRLDEAKKELPSMKFCWAEQLNDPLESRIRRLGVFEKAYRDEKQMLDEAKKELPSMNYCRSRVYKLSSSEDSDYEIKREKLKKCINEFPGGITNCDKYHAAGIHIKCAKR